MTAEKVKKLSEHVAEKDPDSFGRLRELIVKTNKTDAKEQDVKELRAYLDRNPKMWRVVGDLAQQAQARVLEVLNATPPLRVSLEVGLKQLREELGYKDSPAIERLMIDRVILCWLRMNLIEFDYTAKTMTGDSHTLTLGLYLERRMSLASNRYNKALESLAKLRVLTQAVRPKDEKQGEVVRLTGTSPK